MEKINQVVNVRNTKKMRAEKVLNGTVHDVEFRNDMMRGIALIDNEWRKVCQNDITKEWWTQNTNN